MSIKDYLKESPKTFAFWISPKGEITGSMKSHIAQVIEAPEKFGITREYIQSKYKEYGEKLGLEGKAREEIMKEILERGFIRIRKYGSAGWTVNTGKMNKKLKERITKWAEKITEKGISGIKETSTGILVKISDLFGYNKSLPINKVSAGYLIFENKSLQIDFDLIECKSVNEFEDYKE